MFIRWIDRDNRKGTFTHCYLSNTSWENGKPRNQTICSLGKIPQKPDKLDREVFWRDVIRVLNHQTLSQPDRSKIEAAIAQRVSRGKNLLGDADACVEWYTPPRFIEMAREVMGAIDLDPASNEVAQQWIKATRYFTESDDGLAQKWTGRVWCNPPYGRKVNLWLEKGLTDYSAGHITPAIFLLNRTGAAWYKTLRRQVTAVCEVEKRISFVDATGKPQGSPRYYNDFLYLGDNPTRFESLFAAVGDVVILN